MANVHICITIPTQNSIKEEQLKCKVRLPWCKPPRAAGCERHGLQLSAAVCCCPEPPHPQRPLPSVLQRELSRHLLLLRADPLKWCASYRFPPSRFTTHTQPQCLGRCESNLLSSVQVATGWAPWAVLPATAGSGVPSSLLGSPGSWSQAPEASLPASVSPD